MYKFTNRLIVFDKKTADDFIKAGYKLLEKKEITEVEKNNEDSVEYKSVKEEHKRSEKKSNKI